MNYNKLDIINKINASESKTLDELKTQTGFYYDPNIQGDKLVPIQSVLYSNNNIQNTFSLVLFRNSTQSKQPIKTEVSQQSSNDVHLNEGEISVKDYNELSDVDKIKYLAITTGSQNDEINTIKYKRIESDSSTTHFKIRAGINVTINI